MNGEDSKFAFSMKQLESVVKMIPSGLAITDENGIFTLVNPAFCEILNLEYSHQEILGKPSEDILNNFFQNVKQPQNFISLIKELTHNRDPYLEQDIQLENGQILQVNFVPSIEGENYFGYLWTFRDISEQVKSQISIEENKNFYEEIINKLPSDVVVFTPQFKYFYINETAVRDPEIRKWMIGKNEFDYCEKRNRNIEIANNRYRLFQEVIKTGKKVEFEEEGTIRPGEKEYKIRNLQPVFEKDGSLKMVIGYGLDITRIKKFETELEEARRLAEENAAAKEILLANVSHELRTPLNGINGILEILSDSGLNEEQKHLVGLLQYSSLNLLTLVNDLLNLAQIKRGEIVLHQTPVSITELLNNISGIFRLQAIEKNLSWKYINKIPDRIHILADKTRITQILNNLISNAIKFTGKGEITFTANLNTINDETWLEFRIKDTGPGIAENLLEKVFDAFTRLHPEPNQFGGTGLGLNITHKLIQLHGGNIQIKSTLGLGSEFIVLLPVQVVNGKNLVAEKNDQLELESQNILIIEDHPVNRFLLNNQLESAGHKVTNAESAQEALSILATTHFDLILLDFNLPDIPGQELIQMIHKSNGSSNIPVIAITANALPETRLLALSSGFAEFISKPYRTKELLEKITSVIRNLKSE